MIKKYDNTFDLLEDLGKGTKIQFDEEERIFIDAMAQIAGQLMAYRKEHNLTQKDLAEKLGISQAMVSKIERGKNVSIRVLSRIVSKLGGRLEVSLGISKEAIQKKDKIPALM